MVGVVAVVVGDEVSVAGPVGVTVDEGTVTIASGFEYPIITRGRKISDENANLVWGLVAMGETVVVGEAVADGVDAAVDGGVSVGDGLGNFVCVGVASATETVGVGSIGVATSVAGISVGEAWLSIIATGWGGIIVANTISVGDGVSVKVNVGRGVRVGVGIASERTIGAGKAASL